MLCKPRYQATLFRGLGCTLDAVAPDGKVHTIAGVGTARDWNVNQCRAYAAESGFTAETWHAIDGLQVVHWHQPAPGMPEATRANCEAATGC